MSLTAHQRTARTNLHLGIGLAIIAGALNAGGFLAIGQYTSHLTGLVSSAADNIVLGRTALVISGFLAILSFVLGAATTAILVNFARRRRWINVFATPLLLEALLLLTFGFVGSTLAMHELVNISFTAVLLCFAMGLQNALITKVSNAEIRTTHVTGLITDVGIELGKSFYWLISDSADGVAVHANRQKLRVHLSLVAAFFFGGLMGAAGFKTFGYSLTIPMAAILALLGVAPSIDELNRVRRDPR